MENRREKKRTRIEEGEEDVEERGKRERKKDGGKWNGERGRRDSRN